MMPSSYYYVVFRTLEIFLYRIVLKGMAQLFCATNDVFKTSHYKSDKVWLAELMHTYPSATPI